MKKDKVFAYGVMGFATIMAIVGLIVGLRSEINRKAEAAADSTTMKVSYEERMASEFFGEFDDELRDGWSDLREGGFTDYTYEMTESEVNGIYKGQWDFTYRTGEVVSIVMYYDVIEDDGYTFGMIDGEHVSLDFINDRYNF